MLQIKIYKGKTEDLLEVQTLSRQDLKIHFFPFVNLQFSEHSNGLGILLEHT